MVFPFGVTAISWLIPTLIRGPAVFVAAEIGVTHPVTPDVLFATYTVGVPDGTAGAEVGLWARVSAGAMTDTAATTTAQATMPDARRRRRRLRPATRAFCTTGPMSGSSAVARSRIARSAVPPTSGSFVSGSFMSESPRLMPFVRRLIEPAGIAKHRAQLVQPPGALAFHVARRAAEQFRDLVHAQVRPVPHHHDHARLGRQRGQCVHHHDPQLRRLRRGRALRQPAREQLPGRSEEH